MRCNHCKVFTSGAASEMIAHAKKCSLEAWRPVVEAVAKRTFTKASRKRREAMGIPIEPMPGGVIAQRKASPMSEAKKRKRKAEKEEQRALMKPANVGRGRVKSIK